MPEYAVAITGASGAVYGLATVRDLVRLGHVAHVVCSKASATVLAHEHGVRLDASAPDATALLAGASDVLASFGGDTSGDPNARDEWAARIRFHHEKDLMAPLASGSYPIAGLAVVPCSLATLGRAASGAGNGLIERAIECALKERRRLVLVPRETPLSAIALANMLTLTRAGAVVLPAMPGFYHAPKSIADLIGFVVSRVLAHLGVHDPEAVRWGGPPAP